MCDFARACNSRNCHHFFTSMHFSTAVLLMDLGSTLVRPLRDKESHLEFRELISLGPVTAANETGVVLSIRLVQLVASVWRPPDNAVHDLIVVPQVWVDGRCLFDSFCQEHLVCQQDLWV